MSRIVDVNQDVLWVDLRTPPKSGKLDIHNKYHRFVYTNFHRAEFDAVLENGRFKAFIFQYDAPTSTTLRLLEDVKSRYPSSPVIMLTEQHSEALAVWALRTRVWDYFVEPVAHQDIDNAINDVLAIKNSDSSRRTEERKKITRISARPTNLKHGARKDLVALAKAYIEENFHREITLKDVADHLCVSYSHLSRLFKQQCACGFNQFLWDARIAAAKMLLLDSEASVTAVCYEVGCSDPGYFATKFRAETSLSPREYRERVQSNKTQVIGL